MKHLLLLSIVLLTAIGCEKDNDKGQILDPLAKLAINAPKESRAETNPDYPTALEVIELTTTIVIENFKHFPNEEYLNLGISDEQKDYENMRILMWGEDIIYNDKLSPVILEGENFILVTRINPETGEIDKTKPISDTLAYVPNAQLRTAEPLIKAAFEAGDFEELYEIFQNSITFIPINGTDFAKLKAEGKN